MKRFLQKTKSGATSLYVVVFASLLFTVIAVGFVTVVMSETAQTINDELSDSAHDAALAGIEDAKLAIIKCLSDSSTSNCDYIGKVVDGSANDGCHAAAKIMGRPEGDTGVLVTESASATSDDDQKTAMTETLQAYTCVAISSDLPDYRSSLSYTDTDTVRVIPLTNSAATHIRISWYATSDNNDYVYRNVNDSGAASFAPISSGVSAPPSLSAELIQTQNSFTIDPSEIDYTNASSQTDRGTVILVPSNKTGVKEINNSGTTTCFSGPTMTSCTTPTGFIKGNDKAQSNTPYIIKCNENPGEEFVCQATIQLPTPVGGTRNDKTAALILSLLYDQPHTDFAIEMFKKEADGTFTQLNFRGAQYAVDSTGRANDVYSRVEARVELSDIYFPYPKYAVQLGDGGLSKSFWVTSSAGNPTGCWYSNDGTVTNCDKSSGAISY